MLENKDAAYFVKQGVDNIMSGNVDAAISDFTNAIKLNPKSEEAYGFRAAEYGKLGQWDEAISDYTHAIALKESEINYIGRGCAYFMVDKYDKARLDLKSALRFNPDSVEANYALSQLESVGY